MYSVSQVRNLSNIKQRLRATLTTWNGASREDNRKKFFEYLGIRMRQRRLELGYTQTRIANICKCTFQQVQKREKGINKIPLDDLIILCEATHTDLDYFFRPLRKLNKKLYVNGRENVHRYTSKKYKYNKTKTPCYSHRLEWCK